MRVVSVSASVIFHCTTKVQKKTSSRTGSRGRSRKKGSKMVVCLCGSAVQRHQCCCDCDTRHWCNVVIWCRRCLRLDARRSLLHHSTETQLLACLLDSSHVCRRPYHHVSSQYPLFLGYCTCVCLPRWTQFLWKLGDVIGDQPDSWFHISWHFLWNWPPSVKNVQICKIRRNPWFSVNLKAFTFIFEGFWTFHYRHHLRISSAPGDVSRTLWWTQWLKNWRWVAGLHSCRVCGILYLLDVS